MTYLEYFELSQEPFSNAPVSRFYYNSSQHSQALTRLLHTVSYMKGLSVLIGDIGAGKTTLARRMLDSLPEEEYEAALLVIIHSGITANWLLKRIALQLGVENPAQEKLALLSQLYQRLLQIYEAGKKAVVLIDEAQMLETRELMEEFRGLLNLEVPERKLISFVFFGLPEIERNLKLDAPLAQRVAMRYRLEPFSADSTEAYIKHRLRLAGCPRMPFTQDAIEALHRRSGGTPRVINTLCDNALFEAFLARMPDIGGDLIEQIADNLGLETGRTRQAQPSVAAMAAAAAQPPPPPPEIIDAEPISEEVALPAAAALQRSGAAGLDPVWSAAVAPKRPSGGKGSWSAAVAPPPAAAPAPAPVQVTLGNAPQFQTASERVMIRPEAMAPEPTAIAAAPPPAGLARPALIPSPIPNLATDPQQPTQSERVQIRPEAMAPERGAAAPAPAGAGPVSNAKIIGGPPSTTTAPATVTMWRAPLPAPVPHSQQPTASGRIPVRLKPQPPPPPPPPAAKPGRIATPIQDAATPPAAAAGPTPDPAATPATPPPAGVVAKPAEDSPLLTATVEEEIPIDTAEEPVNPQAPAPSKARGVDLAEIDRYLEGLNKL